MPAGGLSCAPLFRQKRMKYRQNRAILGVVTDFCLKSVTKVRHANFSENPDKYGEVRDWSENRVSLLKIKVRRTFSRNNGGFH